MGKIVYFTIVCCLSFGSLANAGTITYVGKTSGITDFRGYGQHLYYFPAFNLSESDDFHRTDEGAVYNNVSFEKFLHHVIFPLNRRTFSADAGGRPIGVKARGGYRDWAVFVLPNGETGLSGTIYDDSTRANSNNTFNQIIFNERTPRDFCLNIITDNTNLENIPDSKLVARSDIAENASLEGHRDLIFDGIPDMYTFRYEGMSLPGRLRIQMRTTKSEAGPPVTGAGIAGVMVSDISTCAGR